MCRTVAQCGITARKRRIKTIEKICFHSMMLGEWGVLCGYYLLS